MHCFALCSKFVKASSDSIKVGQMQDEAIESCTPCMRNIGGARPSWRGFF